MDVQAWLRIRSCPDRPKLPCCGTSRDPKAKGVSAEPSLNPAVELSADQYSGGPSPGTSARPSASEDAGCRYPLNLLPRQHLEEGLTKTQSGTAEQLPPYEGNKIHHHGPDSSKSICPDKAQDSRPKAPPSEQVLHRRHQILGPGSVRSHPRSGFYHRRGASVTGIFSRTNPCHHEHVHSTTHVSRLAQLAR